MLAVAETTSRPFPHLDDGGMLSQQLLTKPLPVLPVPIERHDAEQKAAANTSNDQIQSLDQKVRVLERLRENDQDAAATVAKSQPKISLGASGFSFSSADSNFVASLHGQLQVDSRTFEQDNNVPGNDSFLLRRARPIFSGTVYHDFDFMFMPEFGNATPVGSVIRTAVRGA